MVFYACKTLKKARRYVTEYLDMRTAQYLDGRISAATIKTDASALHKLYEIKPEDNDFYHAPKMERTDIRRGRDKTPTIHNAPLMEFGRGTGLRTHKELEVLHGGDYASYDEIASLQEQLDAKKDLTADEHNQLAACNAALRFTDKQHFVVVRKGKGGKLRYAPIIGPYTDEIVRRIKETPEGHRVWAGISHSMFARMNEHQNRAEYSAWIYREYARPIEKIPKDKVNAGTGKAYASEVYHGRKDMKGTAFDKYALGMCAVALGHSFNRTYDVVSHYSYLF